MADGQNYLFFMYNEEHMILKCSTRGKRPRGSSINPYPSTAAGIAGYGAG